MLFHDVAILITLSFRLIFDWRIISCWLQMKQEYTAGIVMTRALCSVPLHATCMSVFLWTLYILQNYDESFGTTPSWFLSLFLDASQLYSMCLSENCYYFCTILGTNYFSNISVVFSLNFIYFTELWGVFQYDAIMVSVFFLDASQLHCAYQRTILLWVISGIYHFSNIFVSFPLNFIYFTELWWVFRYGANMIPRRLSIVQHMIIKELYYFFCII